MTIDELKQRFGGARALATALGVQLNTIRTWKQRGAIPDGAKYRIIKAARDRRLKIRLEDLAPNGDATTGVPE